MDKTFIKDLLVRGIIGVNDWEREKPQDILINITAFTDTAARLKPMLSRIVLTIVCWQKKFRVMQKVQGVSLWRRWRMIWQNCVLRKRKSRK